MIECAAGGEESGCPCWSKKDPVSLSREPTGPKLKLNTCEEVIGERTDNFTT